MIDLCLICGAEVAHYFGRNGSLPVCENVACQQAMPDMINGELQEAEYESWDAAEVIDVSCF